MKQILLFVLLLFLKVSFAAGTEGLTYTTYAAGGATPNVSSLSPLTSGTVLTVNFNWGGGYVLDSSRYDGVAVQFTGYIKVPTSGTYYFGTTTDDGAVLKVNGTTVVDQWREQGPTFWSGSIALSAGSVVPITFWFYENGGGAVAQLYWINPATGNWEIIPSSVLATSSDFWGETVTVSTTDNILITRPTSTGNYVDVYKGTTTSSTSNTVYSISSTQGDAPVYSRSAPNTGGNSIYIKQITSGYNNQVSLEQDGNNNAFTGTDSGWAIINGNGNILNVTQVGYNNIIGLKVNAWGNNLGITQSANNNIFNIESAGNGNSATINQLSNGNIATAKITYDINTVSLTQKTGTGNQSYNTITGNWNSINNVQDGLNNLSIISITGNNNSAAVTQTGSGHSTLLNLIGDKNTVSVTQTGNNDVYSLQQTCNNPAGCSVSVIRSK